MDEFLNIDLYNFVTETFDEIRNFLIDTSLSDFTYERVMLEADAPDDTKNTNNSTPNQKEEKGENFIVTIAKKIAGLFGQFFSKLAELVGGKNSKIDPETYFQSQTGQVSLNYDLNRVMKEAQEAALEGNKLVQLIHKGTGIEATKVDEWLNKVTRILKVGAVPAVLTGTAMASYIKNNKQLKSDIENGMSNLKQAMMSGTFGHDKNVTMGKIAQGFSQIVGSVLNVGAKGSSTFIKAVNKNNA